MANEKRYVLVEVHSVEEFAMPTASGDPRARVNIGALRTLAEADVVLAIEPSGKAVVVKDRWAEHDAHTEALVTTIDARPRDMA